MSLLSKLRFCPQLTLKGKDAAGGDDCHGKGFLHGACCCAGEFPHTLDRFGKQTPTMVWSVQAMLWLATASLCRSTCGHTLPPRSPSPQPDSPPQPLIHQQPQP